MLLLLALFVPIEVYCENYEYEYSEGNDDYAYTDYIQEPPTTHPVSYSKRFRRFGIHTLLTEEASETIDIKGALKEILAGREIDLFTDQVTPYQTTFQSTLTDDDIRSYFDTKLTRKKHDVQIKTNSSTSAINAEMSWFFTVNPTMTEALNMQEPGIDSVSPSVQRTKVLEPLMPTRSSPTDYALINTRAITLKTATLTPIKGNVKFKYRPILRKSHKATRTSAVHRNNMISNEHRRNHIQDANVKEYITYKYSPIPRKSYNATRTTKKENKANRYSYSPLISVSEHRKFFTEIQTLEDEKTTIQLYELDGIWSKQEKMLSTQAKIPKRKLKKKQRYPMIDKYGRWSGINSENMLRQDITTTHAGNDTGNDTNSTTTEKTTTTVPTCRMPTTTAPTTPEPTTTTTTTQRPFDVEYFLAIVANLTADYETNLTHDVNATIRKLPFWTATESTEATTRMVTDYVELKRTVVAKCFVCGLDSVGVPSDANCADAFAGDFLPLVPQDPSAKGKIARYRKYCRYGDVYNYFYNASQPRTLFGRWTGGCSVRWTDMSGIYTQRTCRNNKRPVTGLHYASKRMAKLEMALTTIKNGCIASPVATLLPLSRGISLYSRFHACVCTGSWCNASSRQVAATTLIVTVALWNCCTYMWGLGLLSFYD